MKSDCVEKVLEFCDIELQFELQLLNKLFYDQKVPIAIQRIPMDLADVKHKMAMAFEMIPQFK